MVKRMKLLSFFISVLLCATSWGSYIQTAGGGGGGITPNACDSGEFANAIDGSGILTCDTPAAGGITALTGDVTASGSGSVAATIANLSVTNAKLAGSIAASKLIATDIATVGTITAGTWNGTTISVNHGGTGLATLTANNVILGNGTSTPGFVAPGTSGNTLQSNGTTWISAAPSGSGIAVGNAISGGVANGILFGDASQNLNSVSAFTFDGTNLFMNTSGGCIGIGTGSCFGNSGIFVTAPTGQFISATNGVNASYSIFSPSAGVIQFSTDTAGRKVVIAGGDGTVADLTALGGGNFSSPFMAYGGESDATTGTAASFTSATGGIHLKTSFNQSLRIISNGSLGSNNRGIIEPQADTAWINYGNSVLGGFNSSGTAQWYPASVLIVGTGGAIFGVGSGGSGNPAATIDVRGNGLFTAEIKTPYYYSKEASGGADGSGSGTLSGGTVTITTSACSTSSRIFLTDTSSAITNVGTLTAVAGTGSFVVKSTNVLDTSSFNWFIVNTY